MYVCMYVCMYVWGVGVGCGCMYVGIYVGLGGDVYIYVLTEEAYYTDLLYTNR